MLLSLCSGIIDLELLAALQGLLAETSSVRGVALNVLPAVPCFSAGMCPENDEVMAILMIACNDPNASNQEAARNLWDLSGATITPFFVAPVAQYLSHPHEDIRIAAARALVQGLEKHKEKIVEAMDILLTIYEGLM